jgi:methylmalonyl-CoA/ethylmalonyl-CoA epimerase
MVARMRHIALSVRDPEESAKIFEHAFGMKRVGTASIGIYMSDGVINVALLRHPNDIPGFPPGEKFYGVTHFGMWVDDLEEAKKLCEDVGCKHLMGDGTGHGAYYEVKYTDPNGIVFDLTHSGWRGAVKEVVPADAGKAEAAE